MFSSGTVLLHDNLSPHGQSHLFSEPKEVLVAYDAETARTALKRIAEAGKKGFWAAGYFAYELGFLFEERLAKYLPERSETPLLWFGLYEGPKPFAGLPEAPDGSAENLAPATSFPAYAAAFERVENYIAAGDTYQVNLTFKANFQLSGSPSVSTAASPKAKRPPMAPISMPATILCSRALPSFCLRHRRHARCPPNERHPAPRASRLTGRRRPCRPCQ